MTPVVAALLAAGICAVASAHGLAPTFLAGTPSVTSVTAAHSGANGVVLDIHVRQPSLARTAVGRIDANTTVHEGREAIAVRDRAGRVIGRGRGTIMLRLGTAAGTEVVTVRVRLSGAVAGAVRRVAAQGDGHVSVTSVGQLSHTGTVAVPAPAVARQGLPLPSLSHWAAAPPRLPAPVCGHAPITVTRGATRRIVVRCSGATSMRMTGAPRHGRATRIAGPAGMLTMDYTAPNSGTDTIPMQATGGGGSSSGNQPIVTRGVTMRVIGDSLSAGYGFYGNGTAWTILDFPKCTPAKTNHNDRCTSNSSLGKGSTGPLAFLPDYGFANQVAWPAQLATRLGISSGPTYKNLAVTGATPSEFDTGGDLADLTASVVSDNPDVSIMALGANPVFASFLFGQGHRCDRATDDAAFQACAAAQFTQAGTATHLAALINQLLLAPASTVLVAQYHTAYPALSTFTPARALFLDTYLNTLIATLVKGHPAFGTRLFMLTPPAFPIGLPGLPGPTGQCPTASVPDPVDGPSVQSRARQIIEQVVAHSTFCPSSQYWMLSSEGGEHLTVLGHTQFAQAFADQIRALHILPGG